MAGLQILGPLASGFLLLPLMSERWVLFAFALPWLLMAFRPDWFSAGNKFRLDWQAGVSYAVVLAALMLVFTQRGYEDQFRGSEVFRDNTATIVALGEGQEQAPVGERSGHYGTHSDHQADGPPALGVPQRLLPKNALVVCFGMGTTYRSLLSWDIPVTAVELVPSVPRVFGFYHADGPALLKSPLSNLVIDDGRRYLETKHVWTG